MLEWRKNMDNEEGDRGIIIDEEQARYSRKH
jgi:hypothetical protein